MKKINTISIPTLIIHSKADRVSTKKNLNLLILPGDEYDHIQ